jgi:CheY-like chemotaxis protein
MLVDDEKMVLEGNKEVLEFLSYKVYTCGNGQEAIALYMGKAMKLIWFNYRRKNGQVRL